MLQEGRRKYTGTKATYKMLVKLTPALSLSFSVCMPFFLLNAEENIKNKIKMQKHYTPTDRYDAI